MKLLSTDDINEILEKFRNENYLFLGVYSCDSDFNKIRNYNYTSIVFNTDPSYLPGTHWTGAFIDNINKIIYYYDSLGSVPNECIEKTLKSKCYKIITNKYIHQKNDKLCGFYVIYFILYNLHNIINNKIIKYPKNPNIKKIIEFNFDNH